VSVPGGQEECGEDSIIEAAPGKRLNAGPTPDTRRTLNVERQTLNVKVACRRRRL
jgi:hypothetical protein